MPLRLPRDDERLTVLGMTGTGKTVAGAWHLSQRSFHKMPWTIFDFKGDELLNDIDGVKHVDLDTPQTKKGLYIVHPDVDDKQSVDDYLTKIWEKGNHGIFIDEGYMLERSKAFERIMITGRSKVVPAITLSQRPAWISRFAFSEANFHQVFRLSDKDDYLRVKQFIPYDFKAIPPERHSIWYDLKYGEAVKLGPVPPPDQILMAFKERLGTKKVYI